MNSQPSHRQVEDRSTNGFAAAAFLAAGIGAATLGLAVVVAESNLTVRTALTWAASVGPLSGKVGVALLAWLGAWGVLNATWSRQDVNLGRVVQVTWILLALGLLLVFPPVFQSLSHH